MRPAAAGRDRRTRQERRPAWLVPPIRGRELSAAVGPPPTNRAKCEAQRYRGAHEQGRLPTGEHLDRAHDVGHVVAPDLVGDALQLVGTAAKEIAEPCLLVAQVARARLSPLGDGAQSIGDAVLLVLDLVAQALLDGAAEPARLLAQ